MTFTSSFFTTTAYRLYLAGLFLLPTTIVLSATVPMQSMKMSIATLAVVGALAFAVLGAFKRGGLSVPLNWILASVWLLPIAYLVSASLAPSFQWSLVGGQLDADTVFFMAILALATSLPLYIFNGKSDFVRAFFVLLVSAWIVALFHLVRLIFGAEALSFGILTNPLFSPLGKWNDVSIFFGLVSLLSLITLEALPLKETHRYILMGTLAVSLFLVAVVNFIPVWVVLAIISLGIVLYRLLLAGAAAGKFSIAGTVVFVVAVVAIIFSPSLGSGLGKAFGVEQIEARPSWESTVAVATQTLAGSPLVGSGPNTFLFEWDKYRPVLINNSVFWNADFSSGVGLVATSVVTTGLVGALAWLLFLGLFLFAGVRALMLRPPTDAHAYHLLMASFVGALYMMCMAVIYLPSPQLIIIGFAILGMFAALYHTERGGRTLEIEFRQMPRVGFVAVLVLALTLVVSVVSLYGVGTVAASAVQFERAARAAQVDGNFDAAATLIDSANALYPEDRYYRLAALIHIAKLNTILNGPEADTDDAQAEVQQKFQTELGASVESGLAAVRMNAKNYRNWQSVSGAYQAVVPLNIDGAYEASINALKTAAELNPTMPTLPFAVAQIELAKQNETAARASLDEALRLKQDYIPALLLLAQIELSTGNLREAIKRTEAILVFEPSNPVTHFQVGVLKFENKDPKGAEEAFKAALKLTPEYANARYYLGRTYLAQGDSDAALLEFQEVLRSNPDNQDVVSVIAAIEAGEDPFAPAEPEK